MSDRWRSDWSRHYDQVQWTATTLLTGGIAGLLAYSWSSSTNDWRVSILGLWLTLTTVFYAASFRQMRARLHDAITDAEERAFLQNPRPLRQWPVFLITFTILTGFWLERLGRSVPNSLWAAIPMSLAALIYCAVQGRRPQEQET